MCRIINSQENFLQRLASLALVLAVFFGIALSPGITPYAFAGEECVSGPSLIPDNLPAGLEKSVIIATSEIISDLNVKLNISHTAIGQLLVVLGHVETGTVLSLVLRPGFPATAVGCESDDLHVYLDDEGEGGSIQDLCGESSLDHTPMSPPFYTPQEPLSDFDGEDINGTWVIKVVDTVAGELGSLTEVCVSWNTADLGVSFSGSKNLVSLGSDTSYSLVVSNNSPRKAENVNVVHNVPAGTELSWLTHQNGASIFIPFPAGPFSGQVMWSMTEIEGGSAEVLDFDLDVSNVRTPQTPTPPFPNTTVVEINSPADLPSEIVNYPFSFDSSSHPDVVTADIVLVNDGDSSGGGLNSDGCQPFVNAVEVSGKIALVDYSMFPMPPNIPTTTCSFTAPVNHAISAGAAGLLLINGDDNAPPPPFGFVPPASPSFAIPVTLIGKYNGDAIKNKLPSGSVNATIRLGYQNVWTMFNQAIVSSDTTDIFTANNTAFHPTDIGYDADRDGDPDVIDQCPDDAGKSKPGQCGCGNSDADSDGDGTANCNDSCASDGSKTSPGVCGCGTSDKDSDGDGTEDCNDSCPSDNTKTNPGVCGCNVPDVDANGNGAIDCQLNPELKADISKAVSLLNSLKKTGKGGKAIKAELRAFMTALKAKITQQAGSINLTSADVNITRLVKVATKQVRRATKSRGKVFRKNRRRALKTLGKLNNGIAA